MYDQPCEVDRDYEMLGKGLSETVKQGEVMAEIEQLHEYVARIDKEFGVLAQRISPVLENVPTPNGAENVKPSRNSDLAIRIASANIGLSDTLRKIRETRDRIAL